MIFSHPGVLAESLVLTNPTTEAMSSLYLAAGSHLLISLSTSECLYLNRNTQKVRSLSRWRGHLIESVGWNKLLGSEINTGPILVGTSQGIIFEAEISATEGSLFNTNPDQYFRQVRMSVSFSAFEYMVIISSLFNIIIIIHLFVCCFFPICLSYVFFP